MSKGRGRTKKLQQPPIRHAPSSSGGTRGVLELDRFSEVDLEKWDVLSRSLDQLHNILYFDFAAQRNSLKRELIDALQAPVFPVFKFSDWFRILPYRYSLQPLSAAGSLNGVGGRFNVGRDVPKSNSQWWPALYLANNFETAYRENFGLTKEENTCGLNPEELQLSAVGSFSTVKVEGNIERVFDITDPSVLKPFCDVLKRCKMPAEVARILRKLKLDPSKATKIGTPNQLMKAVMSPSWRAWPVQFDLPSQSQVLGSLLIEAGFEAVVYPSSRTGDTCLAVFPCNLASESTEIRLAQGYPSEIADAALNMESAGRLSGMPC